MKSIPRLIFAFFLISACTKQVDRYVEVPAPAKKDQSACSMCAKGNEQGNGADSYSWGDGSAWFLDATRTVQYCIDISTDFGVGKTAVKQAIVQSVQKWSKYISDKLPDDPNFPKYSNQWNLQSACDGKEDVVFYFGATADLPTEYKDKLASKVAVSIRTAFDVAHSWSKGFVWVTPQGSLPADSLGQTYPNWIKSFNLNGILLHEMGHIYGNEHVGGTIMAKDISMWLSEPYDDVRQMYLSEIDGIQELVICKTCQMNYQGQVGYYTTTTDQNGTTVNDVTSSVFHSITGQWPSSGHASVNGILSGDLDAGLTLSLQDSKGSFRFPLQFDVASKSSYSDSINVFKRVFYANNSIAAAFANHGGYSVHGELTKRSGEKVVVILERNMQTPISYGPQMTYAAGGPLLIRALIDGKYQPLLTVKASEMNK